MKPGRLFALAAIAAMTLLTFASCGPLEFQGMDLLRNEIAAEDIAGSMVGDLGLESAKSDAESGPIFEDDDLWLHWMYIAAFAVAVIALFVNTKLHGMLGLLGMALTACFMWGFNRWFDSQEPGGAASGAFKAELEFEAGAWLTLAAFAAVSIMGFKGRAGKAVD